MACQMASAVYDSLGIEVTSAGYVFKASRSEVKFSGLYRPCMRRAGTTTEEEVQTRLPNLRGGRTPDQGGG